MNLPKTIPLVFFLLLIVSGSLLTKVALAQVPNPYVDCDEVRPNFWHPLQEEFHSLRPYQASPCDEEDSETALFCGNSLVILDTVSSFDWGASCQNLPDGKLKCTVPKTRSIAIDLSGAELPIMGNTEDVRNSQRSDGFDDAEKMNEYVSWYLNGIIGRAENEPIDPETEEGIRKIVDFSGPLKKLLPQSVQHKYQIRTIEKALAGDVNDDGESQERSRHNQIVVCAKEKGIDFLGIGKTVPIECYEGDGSKAKGDVYRLVGSLPQRSWEGNRFDFANIQERLINFGTILLPDIPRETIKSYLGNVWLKKVPPLESQFEDSVFYRKAYNEWRGKTCLLIPVIKFLVCVDNPAVRNKWADLFPYIPFSSTEDRVGLVELDSFGIQPVSENVTITNVSIDYWSPAKLYFAHMEETSELAEILQQTFVPKDGNMTGGVTGVSPGGDCDLVNVRTNEGDDLFAGEIGGILSYDAEFSCDLYENATESACTKQVLVSLSVLTKTPKADEVWSRTVAGPSAIFKRIFPKVGPGGAILRILDIPAATKVTYIGADFAGNPGNQRSGESAELYFPHIGGVSEYFLKGIQTILRPKGFGEQIISGSEPGGTCQTGFGPCSVENLLPYFGNDLTKATNASMVCHLESGGNSNALNDRCLTSYPPGSRTYDYSVGLFQINLLAHCANNAFDSGWGPPPYCTILDQAKVNSCKIKYSDPDENIRYAVQLSRNGTTWAPWKAAARLCGLPY
ncbi:hypothetical protein KAT60_01130 [Candidatus Woesebacteria bacterium]|nr:hypothetical protein [Candidatus Woesebacteria bacterium]